MFFKILQFLWLNSIKLLDFLEIILSVLDSQNELDFVCKIVIAILKLYSILIEIIKFQYYCNKMMHMILKFKNSPE